MDNKKATDALNLLKSLESYAYSERVFKIADVNILLAPLTSGETIDVFESSNKYEDPDAASQVLKVETLTRSIIAVNDVRFDPKSMIDEKREIVKSFGDELVDLMFNEYCELDKSIKEVVDKKLMNNVKIEEDTEMTDGSTK